VHDAVAIACAAARVLQPKSARANIMSSRFIIVVLHPSSSSAYTADVRTSKAASTVARLRGGRALRDALETIVTRNLDAFRDASTLDG